MHSCCQHKKARLICILVAWIRANSDNRVGLCLFYLYGLFLTTVLTISIFLYLLLMLDNSAICPKALTNLPGDCIANVKFFSSCCHHLWDNDFAVIFRQTPFNQPYAHRSKKVCIYASDRHINSIRQRNFMFNTKILLGNADNAHATDLHHFPRLCQARLIFFVTIINHAIIIAIAHFHIFAEKMKQT